MRFPTFLLERNQTLHENAVRLNLTESGLHPRSLRDVLTEGELAAVLDLPLGYGWTDGTPRLRQVVAGWYPGASPANVLVANGSSEANLLALTTLVEPGDEVVVVTPNFLQLDGLAGALGCAVRQVALRPQDGWQPDPEAIRAALTPATRLVTLCDPNNPTGVLMRPEARAAVAEAATTTGAWLLVDEIYRGSEIDLGIDGGDSPTAWGTGERVIVSGGLSKSFALPGLRLGWLVAPEAVVAECHRRQDYTTIGTSPLSQAVAEAVLAPATRDRLLTEGRGRLREGRAAVEAWARAGNGWTFTRPDSGGMAFLGYGAPIPSEDLVRRLREEEGAFVCAGTWFGVEGHVRVGIGVEPDTLVAGLAAMDRLAARLSAA